MVGSVCVGSQVILGCFEVVVGTECYALGNICSKLEPGDTRPKVLCKVFLSSNYFSTDYS